LNRIIVYHRGGAASFEYLKKGKGIHWTDKLSQARRFKDDPDTFFIDELEKTKKRAVMCGYVDNFLPQTYVLTTSLVNLLYRYGVPVKVFILKCRKELMDQEEINNIEFIKGRIKIWKKPI
jgi:hypothetical protein